MTSTQAIAIAQTADTSHTLTWSADAGATLEVDYNIYGEPLEGNSAMVAEGTEVTVFFVIEDGYVFDKINVKSGQEFIAIFNERDEVGFSFTMPGNDTHIHVYASPALSGTWVRTLCDYLTEDDIFVMVSINDINYDSYAMSNNNFRLP